MEEVPACPEIHPAGLQVDVRRCGLVQVEYLFTENECAIAIGIPAPAVKRTDETLLAAIAGPGRQADTAVPAGVMKRLHSVIRPPADHRAIEDRIFGEIAYLGDLLQTRQEERREGKECGSTCR